MKDKEYQKQRARLQKRVPYWISLITALAPWRIHCVYCDTPTDMPQGDEPSTTYDKVIAKVSSDWRYLDAIIHWNMETIKMMDDDELDRVITHELSHIIVNEMREEHIHHEERVCTELGNSIYHMERANKIAVRTFLKQKQSRKKT